jgi:hypothetical protein
MRDTVKTMEVSKMYETKVVLVAVSNIMRKSKDLKEAHEALEEMANAEGVVLKPFDENNDKISNDKNSNNNNN